MSDAAAPAAVGILSGRRILVVEDDYFLAEDLAEELRSLGAEVRGPAPSVAAALGLLADGPEPDMAVLDVNLGGETVVPVAEELLLRGVPFAFVTGYDRSALPDRFADAPRFEKPLDTRRLMAAIRAALGGP